MTTAKPNQGNNDALRDTYRKRRSNHQNQPPTNSRRGRGSNRGNDTTKYISFPPLKTNEENQHD